MTETLSDASKLMREAKASEFAEPKEPQSIEKDLAEEVLRAGHSDVGHNRRGVRKSE